MATLSDHLSEPEVRQAYHRAYQILVGLPHPDVIPDSWRPESNRTEQVSLEEIVYLIARHSGPNSIGAPQQPK